MTTEESSSARPLRGNPFRQSESPPERLSGLKVAIDAFSAILAKKTEPLLREPLACAVESIDPVRLFDALTMRRGQPVAHLFATEIGAHAFVAFASDFDRMLLGAAFSGQLTAAHQNRESRPTSVGARFVAEFARLGADALTEAFARVSSLSFRFERLETVGDSMLADRREVPMVAARIAAKSLVTESHLVLLLPQWTINRMRQELSETPPEEPPVVDPAWTDALTIAVSKTPLEISAVMEDLKLTVSEVASLKVGQVIPLKGSSMGRVQLLRRGRQLFSCRLLKSDQRYDLEIE